MENRPGLNVKKLLTKIKNHIDSQETGEGENMPLAQMNAELSFGQLVSAVTRLSQTEFEKFFRRVMTYEKKGG